LKREDEFGGVKDDAKPIEAKVYNVVVYHDLKIGEIGVKRAEGAREKREVGTGECRPLPEQAQR